MIADLKPYPAMKDSGVEWLGQVPEHWKLVPNRALMRLRKEVVGDRADDYILLSLTKQGIIVRDMENPEGKFPESFDTYQVVKPGDLIFCLFDIDETPRAVGLSRLSGMITGAYTRFVCPDEIARRFIYLLYLSLDNGKLLKPLYSGLRKVIQKSTFLSAKVALPPPAEQTAIVRYLDYVDRRVRRLVRAKQKLIGLLEEQKQAIIHRAVTRGLDPDVRLKDSDVEWLGKVPEHWEVRKIKHCLSAPLAYGVLKPDKFDGPGAVPIIRILDIAAGVIREDRLERISPAQHQEFRRTQVVPGDVLISVVGTIGRSVIVPATLGRANLSRALCRVQVNEQITPEFLDRFCWSHSFLQQADSIPAGAAQRVLNLGDLRQFDIGVPPLPEQVAIVEYLEQATTDLDSAIDRASREIGLLEEYRTCLIAGVVTGKLDVREAVAVLPEVDPLDVEDHLDDGTDAAAEADLADLNAIPEEAEA